MKSSTIMAVLRNAEKKLAENGVQNPRLDAQIMLSRVLDKQTIYLYINRDKVLSDEELSLYNCMLTRRIRGEPVQYIIGQREFMSLDFEVKSGVLIPRPDTEILVEEIIRLSKKILQTKPNITIADIGTGSGAIAVSLAKYIYNAKIYATDISEKALEVAKSNARKHGVDTSIDFIKTSLLSGLEGKGLDIIVSNPPYIPSAQIAKLQREVKDFEPVEALDGGRDGLDFYRLITEKAPRCLGDRGILVFEVGYGQSRDVENIILNTGYFKDIRILKDLASIDRVVISTVG
ncbi:MAG: peptide chain release factor N(5)-glutamine methyltransferase [Clostridia bacterium]|nr:peptide chain release factor N(5)-glutamine methyltransferase [Clostridia bacterium]